MQQFTLKILIQDAFWSWPKVRFRCVCAGWFPRFLLISATIRFLCYVSLLLSRQGTVVSTWVRAPVALFLCFQDEKPKREKSGEKGRKSDKKWVSKNINNCCVEGYSILFSYELHTHFHKQFIPEINLLVCAFHHGNCSFQGSQWIIIRSRRSCKFTHSFLYIVTIKSTSSSADWCHCWHRRGYLHC